MSNNIFANREHLWEKIIVIIAVIVPVLVTALVYISPPSMAKSLDLTMLPKFHAVLNGSVAVMLLLSFYFIKNK